MLVTWDQEFGKRLAAARMAAGLTQTQFGEQIGLSRSSIANMEAGRQRIPGCTLAVVTVLLRADPAWMLLGDTATAPGPAIDPRPVRREAAGLRRLAEQLTDAAITLDELADSVDLDFRGDR